MTRGKEPGEPRGGEPRRDQFGTRALSFNEFYIMVNREVEANLGRFIEYARDPEKLRETVDIYLAEVGSGYYGIEDSDEEVPAPHVELTPRGIGKMAGALVGNAEDMVDVIASHYRVNPVGAPSRFYQGEELKRVAMILSEMVVELLIKKLLEARNDLK